jgi:uncharacterized membrane protein
VRHPLDVLRADPVRPHSGTAVLVAAAASAAWYGWVLVRRDGMLLARAYDQAFFQAVVWNAGHGGGFRSGYWPASFLGLHFSPLLAAPAAMELVWADPRLLSALHALAIAAMAPAAYLLLSAMLPPVPAARPLAAALAAGLPLSLLLQRAAIAGFHPEATGIVAALLAGWAGLRGRHASMAVLAVVALAAREDLAYALLVVALALAALGRRPAGLLLAAGAGVWAAVVVGAVMPALRAGTDSQLSGYYAWLPTASAAQVLSALAQPAGWLAALAAVVGLCGLPLLRPWWLLAALPPLLGDLLSRHDPQPALQLQYGLPLVVPLVVAAGFGARALLASRWRIGPRAAWLVGLPAVAVVVLGPPAARGWVPATPVPGALAAVRSCAAAVPAAAPLAADDAAASAVAARRRLVDLGAADDRAWLLVDRMGDQPGYVDRDRRARVLASLPGGRRRVGCAGPRFELWSAVGG